MPHVHWREHVHRHHEADDARETPVPMQGTAPGGEVAWGTGPGGNRYGNGSLTCVTGTGSMSNRAMDGALDGEQFIITDSGEHIRLSELLARQRAE